jgi:hypothetical protein
MADLVLHRSRAVWNCYAGAVFSQHRYAGADRQTATTPFNHQAMGQLKARPRRGGLVLELWSMKSVLEREYSASFLMHGERLGGRLVWRVGRDFPLASKDPLLSSLEKRLCPLYMQDDDAKLRSLERPSVLCSPMAPSPTRPPLPAKKKKGTPTSNYVWAGLAVVASVALWYYVSVWSMVEGA